MSDGLTAYTCTPRQIRKHVVACMMAGLVPFIQSSPAMGKSSIVASIAQEFNLKLIDHRLSTSAPEDLSGLPHFTKEGTACFAPFDMFPTENLALPEGKQGWLLFLDEFNSASKSVQAAAYKLILDRMVGQHKLHERVVIVCAGNLATDRAIVNPISTAMQSRVIHLIMELDNDEFMEDVAFKFGWDPRIIAFLSYKPGYLHDFKPDHNDKTFCAPRTWEFVNRLIRDKPVSDTDAALYAGAITSGVAVEFIQFTKVYEALPKIGEIVRAPNTHPLPPDAATRYATVIHLLEKTKEENFKEVAEYISRLSSEFRILFFRGIRAQRSDLVAHPVFRNAMVQLGKYLFDVSEAA